MSHSEVQGCFWKPASTTAAVSSGPSKAPLSLAGLRASERLRRSGDRGQSGQHGTQPGVWWPKVCPVPSCQQPPIRVRKDLQLQGPFHKAATATTPATAAFLSQYLYGKVLLLFCLFESLVQPPKNFPEIEVQLVPALLQQASDLYF